MNRTLFLSIFSFGGLFCAAQQPPEVPRQDFSAPMAHKRVLAGTFGELRDGHFHSGDDFKTQFVVGKEILAPADGSVVRVSVSHGGYGKALYLRHPNGYTTVYGHLNGFAPKIDSVVHAENGWQNPPDHHQSPRDNSRQAISASPPCPCLRKDKYSCLTDDSIFYENPETVHKSAAGSPPDLLRTHLRKKCPGTEN